MEEWAPIDGFDNYEVSDDGRVRNSRTDRVLRLQDNGHGVMVAYLRRGGKTIVRSVARLVAEAFLDPAPDDASPMHLDFDLTNNRAENLVWKPRWFAIKMTRQNKRIFPVDRRPVRMNKTGVVFENALECAKTIGGLEELVIITAQNRYGATYLGSTFDFVYDFIP